MIYRKPQNNWELKLKQGLPVSRITVSIRWENLTRRLAKAINNFRKDSSVLDIGAGDGSLYFLISKICKLYIAIEPSIKMINEFKKGPSNHVCQGYGENLPCRSRAFDIVVLNSALDHCFNPDKTIIESYRVLKESGKIFILLANEGVWYKTLLKKYNTSRKESCHEHNFYFSADEIRYLLQKYNFKDISIKYFDFIRGPVVLENLLFKIFPEKILHILIKFLDRISSMSLRIDGGSFLCVATK